jgi:hypothetical protein
MAWKEWDYLEVLTSADLNGNFAECVRLDEIQTLTNKTLTTPVITDKSATGTDAGTETLVNKTLTSPVIAAMGSAFTIPAAASTPAANTMVNEAIIKAWGSIDYDGTVNNSYNINTVSRTAQGRYNVSLKRSFSNGNFVVVSNIFNANAYFCSIAYLSTNLFQVNIYDAVGNWQDAPFNFIAIGAQ